MRSFSLHLIILLLLTACQQGAIDDATESGAAVDTSPVLATVNGEEIRQRDVDFMIERTFSGADQLFFDEQMQQKVLQSLIASKAMQQSVKAQLSPDERAQIEQKIAAYGEELYVKEYLVQNATPEPVSTQMVTEYYENNPEQFGGGESKVFELLKTAARPTEQQRDKILSAIPDIKQAANWASFAESQANDMGLSYFTSKMQPGLLEPELERAVASLKPDQVSDVVLVSGIPHILRVTKVEQLSAKPLSAVSASIRKKLAALQLKKAVKKASDDVIKQAEVTLSEPAES